MNCREFAATQSYYSRYIVLECEVWDPVYVNSLTGSITPIYVFTHQPSGEKYYVYEENVKTARKRLIDKYNGAGYNTIPVIEGYEPFE